MTEIRICPQCKMEFDWPGVQADGEFYCCVECSVGEPCSCPQHKHGTLDADVLMPIGLGQPGPL